MLLRLKEGKCTCVHFPVITNSSEGTRLLEHVFRESVGQLELMCGEHLLQPVLAGAGDTGLQGGPSVGDTTNRNL